MADVTLDIEKVLDTAVDSKADAEDSSPDEVSQESEGSEKQTKGKGAQGRIQELIAKQKALEEEHSSTKSKLSERDAELGKLLDLLQARENDAHVVQKINELYQNPEHKDFIEYLDQIVQGKEVDKKPVFSSKTETKDPDKGSELLKTLDAKKAEISEAIAEERAEAILEKADQLTDSWLDELPKEYGEEDKRILQEALVNRIDWDSVEAQNGKNIRDEMKRGFQETLNWYGKPKGLQTNKGDDKEETESPEQETQKLRAFINQDWGKLEDKEVNGTKVRVPVISDEEFASSMAKVLKRQNRLQ